jgi:hypothetical protein
VLDAGIARYFNALKHGWAGRRDPAEMDAMRVARARAFWHGPRRLKNARTGADSRRAAVPLDGPKAVSASRIP